MMPLPIICTFLLLAATSNAATPTISNVSGTISTGQTLTVAGINMVDHNTTNWQANYDGAPAGNDFDGDFEQGSGSWGDWEAGWGLEGSNHASCVRTFDTSRKIIGLKSAKYHLQGAIDSSGGGVGCATYILMEKGQDYYMSAYQQWDTSVGDGSWPNNFMKVFLSGTGNQLYSQFKTPMDSPPVQWLYDAAKVTEVVGDIPGGAIKNSTWYHIETYTKSSSPQRGIVWINGVKIIDTAVGTALAHDMMVIGIPNLAATSTGFAIDSYVDRFTVSSSRIYPSSTIEIANSATYATATKRYQEPLYLSDGSVQIKADLTGLGAGPYYLYITNNRQEVSAAYALSGGGGDTNGGRSGSGSASFRSGGGYLRQ